jgi:hypothetical protein
VDGRKWNGELAEGKWMEIPNADDKLEQVYVAIAVEKIGMEKQKRQTGRMVWGRTI